MTAVTLSKWRYEIEQAGILAGNERAREILRFLAMLGEPDANGWYPIERALKSEGSPIWLASESSMRLGVWYIDHWADFAKWQEVPRGLTTLGFEPTHWQPLPEMPVIYDLRTPGSTFIPPDEYLA